MKSKKFALSALSAIAMTIAPYSPARAWDGTPTGTISNIDITGGSNLGFRVSISGAANMCNGGPYWAYLNEADSNYKVYVAALLMAKAQGSKVIVYSNLEGAYCHIGYITVTSN